MNVMTYDEKQKMTHADLLTLVAELQEHVLILSSNVQQLKKITGWTSGYDDNNWPIENSLNNRVSSVENYKTLTDVLTVRVSELEK